MAVLDNNDQDLMQLWAMITELSEQLNQNRNLSVALYGQAGNIKVCAKIIGKCNATEVEWGIRTRRCIVRRGSCCVGMLFNF